MHFFYRKQSCLTCQQIVNKLITSERVYRLPIMHWIKQKGSIFFNSNENENVIYLVTLMWDFLNRHYSWLFSILKMKVANFSSLTHINLKPYTFSLYLETFKKKHSKRVISDSYNEVITVITSNEFSKWILENFIWKFSNDGMSTGKNHMHSSSPWLIFPLLHTPANRRP